MSACLDSWAVLAWLDGEEPALSRVEQSLADRPVVSWINLVEVYYRVARDQGNLAADETLGDLRTALAPDLPGTARMIEVARLKARTPIALGDCFAVTTAAAHDLPLLTGDPEIIDLSHRPCEVEDLRGPAQTQQVTGGDLAAGIVRVPSRSKPLFPAERALMTVALRGASLRDVRWDPRLGPDRERSAVLGIGKKAASQLIEGERLGIARIDGGVRLD